MGVLLHGSSNGIGAVHVTTILVIILYCNLKYFAALLLYNLK